MPYDRNRTDGMNISKHRKNRPEKNDTQRSRKGITEKPYTGKRDAERKDYRQFEYHPDERRVAQEQTENPNEYILTGRNPIREALKSGHDLEKMLVQRGELSGSAR